MKQDPLHELLCQALEAALGSVAVHRTARACAMDDLLLQEWDGQLSQHENRARVLRRALEELGLDPEEEVPGRLSIRHIGQALVKAMQMALVSGNPDSTQRVAVGCVVLVQANDCLNWELIGQFVMKAEGRRAQVLGAAWDQIHDEDQSHGDHTLDRCRQLWIDFLGLSPVFPLSQEQTEARVGQQARKVQSVARGRGAKIWLGLAPASSARSRDREPSSFTVDVAKERRETGWSKTPKS